MSGILASTATNATLEPVTYYNKLPPAAEVDLCLVLDPMLATGGSAIAAVDILKRWARQRLSSSA